MLLLKNEEDLDDKTYKKDHILNYTTNQSVIVHQMLMIDREIEKAYKLKELYRSFDGITMDEINDYDMERTLDEIIKEFNDSNIEEIEKTLKNWKQEILNSFVWVNKRRISNGPIEGKNYYIKKIIYNGNGMINFERARNRILYSQNMYEAFDISYEYTDSIKMKSTDYASYEVDEMDKFEEIE